MTSKLTGVDTKLQQELRQTKPFSSREEEAHLSILRTAEVLWQGMAEMLKSAELTPTQYNVLRILRGAGRPGRSCGEISERMVTKDSDITRLLNRLEARGLIARERTEEDRRVINARITREGLRLLDELDGPVAQHHRQTLGHLGAGRLTQLCELLEAVRIGRA
jgi:DNA-binding MarR family transcriptional regulator